MSDIDAYLIPLSADVTTVNGVKDHNVICKDCKQQRRRGVVQPPPPFSLQMPESVTKEISNPTATNTTNSENTHEFYNVMDSVWSACDSGDLPRVETIPDRSLVWPMEPLYSPSVDPDSFVWPTQPLDTPRMNADAADDFNNNDVDGDTMKNSHDTSMDSEFSSMSSTRRSSTSSQGDDRRGSGTSEDGLTVKKMKKRNVSFNDQYGMPLTMTRVLDEPAEPDLDSLFSMSSALPDSQHVESHIELQFTQPGSNPYMFMKKIEAEKVSLESIRTENTNIIGTIRVLNIAFEKEVFVRHTIDGWSSQLDIATTFVPLADGNTIRYHDVFSFGLSVAPSAEDVQFAVCYRVAGQEFWDNNNGGNYRLRCVPNEDEPLSFTAPYSSYYDEP